MTEIQGRVAVVTGGASGIGRGIAEALLEQGAQVVLSDISAEGVQATAGELGATGFHTDVTNPDALQRLADDVVEEYGRVDIIVNNAGVGPEGRFDRLTLEDWRWIMDVNFFGVVNGIHAFLPYLRSNPSGGHIVNTASMSVFFDFPGLGAYTASKEAVVGLSRVLAAELSQDRQSIGVTVLPPGPVRTNIKNSLKHRPANQNGGLKDVDLESSPESDQLRWIEPLEAGRIVTRAIRANDFWALTHPEWWPMVAERNALDEAAFSKYKP